VSHFVAADLFSTRASDFSTSSARPSFRSRRTSPCPPCGFSYAWPPCRFVDAVDLNAEFDSIIDYPEDDVVEDKQGEDEERPEDVEIDGEQIGGDAGVVGDMQSSNDDDNAHPNLNSNMKDVCFTPKLPVTWSAISFGLDSKKSLHIVF
jgi:hypothetical protein